MSTRNRQVSQTGTFCADTSVAKTLRHLVQPESSFNAGTANDGQTAYVQPAKAAELLAKQKPDDFQLLSR